jgi:hypothetical protein
MNPAGTVRCNSGINKIGQRQLQLHHEKPAFFCLGFPIFTRGQVGCVVISPGPFLGHGRVGALHLIGQCKELFRRQRGSRAALMRINIWIVLAILLVLLAVTRSLQSTREDTLRICADDAPVCER